MSGAKKWILGILAVLLILTAGAYTGIAVYFRSHFFPNTAVSGYNCSRMTAEELEQHNSRTGSDYLLSIYDRMGAKYHLRGMDFGYEYVHSGEEARILESQNAFSWPLEISKNHVYTLDMSYTFDNDALQKQIFALPLFDEENITEPVDAEIVRSDSGAYEVSPSSQGNAPIEEMVADIITKAVSEGRSDCMLTDSCYKEPQITEDSPEIADFMNKVNAFQNATIHYEIDGVDENLSSGTIAKMLDIDDDHNITINEEKVESFVQYLATTYNTFGDVRSFKTAKGDKIKIGGGDYGWVIDKSGEKKQILEDLKNGEPVSREPVYEQTARHSGAEDIGDTYVELDYTNQHLYYIEDGEQILDSDIVSGNISRGNGSPDGIFKIVYKQSPATLVGETYQSDVTYFMPFAYNVGIHDASWRSKFGGEIYRRSGSHGCVNVPLETAKKLYKILEVGTPVVAYYRESVELTSNSNRISNAYSYVD